MVYISLDLPYPPSANKLWRSNRGRVHRSASYLQWIAKADDLVMTQKKGPLMKISGQFIALLQVVRQNKRRADIDNRAKAVLDYCTRLGIIEDDSLCKMIPLMWTDKAYLGKINCRVSLWSLDDPPVWLSAFPHLEKD